MARELEPTMRKEADFAGATAPDRAELPKPAGELPAAFAGTAPLVDKAAAQDFQGRWDNIQVSFVDEPRRAVEQADNLVAETMKGLADNFARERSNLESQWEHGEPSTEDLRQALQRYRSFFQRLLAA